MSKVETDLNKIVALLAEKGRTTRKELGTDAPTMKLLEQSGIVVRDGIIKTEGSRGKPPIAYKLAEGKSVEDVAEISAAPKRTRASNSDESLQNRLERVLAEVQASSSSDGCTCVRTWQGISYELVRWHPGCKDRWICSSLVRVREKAGLIKL
jgi:hypothetical protein